MIYKKRTITSISILVLSTILLQSCSQGIPPTVPSEIRPAHVETADPQRLLDIIHNATGHGKVVIFNLWATWCPPCVAEMPMFAQFIQDYTRANKNLFFLSVRCNKPESIATQVTPFVRQHQLPFNVYVMTNASPAFAGSILGFDWDGTLPVTVVYDSDGELVAKVPDELNRSALASLVDPLLK